MSDHGDSIFGMKSSGTEPITPSARTGESGFMRARRASGISCGRPM